MKETARRSAYLREAAVQLFMARTAVSLLPARYVLRHAGRPPRQLSRFRNEEIAWIVWAVQEAATRARLAGTALPPALAIQSMMRRRGIASRLCLGVERAAGHAVSRMGRGGRTCCRWH